MGVSGLFVEQSRALNIIDKIDRALKYLGAWYGSVYQDIVVGDDDNCKVLAVVIKFLVVVMPLRYIYRRSKTAHDTFF